MSKGLAIFELHRLSDISRTGFEELVAYFIRKFISVFTKQKQAYVLIEHGLQIKPTQISNAKENCVTSFIKYNQPLQQILFKSGFSPNEDGLNKFIDKFFDTILSTIPKEKHGGITDEFYIFAQLIAIARLNRNRYTIIPVYEDTLWQRQKIPQFERVYNISFMQHFIQFVKIMKERDERCYRVINELFENGDVCFFRGANNAYSSIWYEQLGFSTVINDITANAELAKLVLDPKNTIPEDLLSRAHSEFFI